MYVTPKMFECHFSGRLTFSSTRGRLLVQLMDHLLYHYAIQKPFLHRVNQASSAPCSFVWRTNSSVSIIIQIDFGTSLGSKSTAVAACRTDNKQNRCRLEKIANVRSSTLEDVFHQHVGSGLCMPQFHQSEWLSTDSDKKIAAM